MPGGVIPRGTPWLGSSFRVAIAKRIRAMRLRRDDDSMPIAAPRKSVIVARVWNRCGGEIVDRDFFPARSG